MASNKQPHSRQSKTMPSKIKQTKIKQSQIKQSRSSKAGPAKARPSMRSILSALGAIAVGGVSIATGVLGVPYVRQESNARLLQMDPTVRIAWPQAAGGEDGTWMPADMQATIVQTVHDQLGATRDHLSPASLARVGQALVEMGWFVGAPTVTRERGGVVSVTGIWRTPAAVVRDQGRDRLISWGGELLPVDWAAGGSPLIAITGVAGAPPRDQEGRLDHGQRWESDSMRGALDLLRLLLAQPYRSQIGAIDVSGLEGGDNRITIITDKGSRVVWGSRPGVNAVDRGEVTPPRRLENLGELFRMTGRIDANLPHVEVFRQHVQLDRRGVEQTGNPTGNPDER